MINVIDDLIQVFSFDYELSVFSAFVVPKQKKIERKRSRQANL